MFNKILQSPSLVKLNIRTQLFSTFTPLYTSCFEIPSKVEIERAKDMPIEMENPYEKEKPKCFLCEYDVKVDYKNVRLLSQFVSRYTGKVYGRHISGLCEKQQRIIENAIRKARTSGLMAYYFKDPIYDDPPLFDPEKPFRPHKY